jgi:hypothetical protein
MMLSRGVEEGSTLQRALAMLSLDEYEMPSIRFGFPNGHPMSYDEISRRTGISIYEVKSRYYRALRNLTAAMKGIGDPNSPQEPQPTTENPDLSS